MESLRDYPITEELSVLKERAAAIATDQMLVEEIRFGSGKLSRHSKDA
jgi:hypothetical protein